MKNLVKGLYFFLNLISLSIFSHAHETPDIETLPRLRTRQYSIDPYEKVAVFSAPRTGSSLVYNVLRFLFEKEENLFCAHNAFGQSCSILRTHKYNEPDLIKGKNVLYVVPIRNPLHASVSNYRICPHPIKNDVKRFSQILLHRQRDRLLFAEGLQRAGSNVIFIKYEDFVDNLDHLFDAIERCFFISISHEDKDIIREGYAKENIASAIKKLPSFKQSLPLSGFHGKHIAPEKYVPPSALMHWLHYYLKDVQPVFEKYGYFLD